MRPNPFLVARQPPIKVRGKIVRSDMTDVDSTCTAEDSRFRHLVQRIEKAEVITEGARYMSEDPAKFYGSAVLTLRRDSDASPNNTQKSGSILKDLRLRRLVEDRLYREILRHLGSEATETFEWQARESQETGEHRVFMDFECVLAVMSAASDRVSH